MAVVLKISGRVQGVGFRPHVYKLAHKLSLAGWVRNVQGLVEIYIQGKDEIIQEFISQVIHTAPVFAIPKLVQCYPVTDVTLHNFTILPSISNEITSINLPPDVSICNECLLELNNPVDKRYRYPFINCTQCGPRYTLIKNLPYDREFTTMADFSLCSYCYREYTDSNNRRFHAEPIACTDCGPSLHFCMADISIQNNNDLALQHCVAALQNGLIVAIRGIGGYHLCCRADQHAVIMRLRERKPRPHKPLAVMFPAPNEQPLREITRYVNLTPDAIQLLLSPIHPIVLAPRRHDCSLPSIIAPGLNELGVLLPYTPLHHLLLNELNIPLIVTSANLSGESILIEPEIVETHLSHVATAFLHHNRTILRPADDAVYRYIGSKFRPLRLGRGNSPVELTLPIRLSQPVLATGGHTKNTIALAWDKRVIISPHIGDLNSARSLAMFESTINDLQTLYGVTANLVLCDAHPEYASTRWAKQCGLPVHKIFHHHAHAAAVYGEAGGRGEWLIFTWDGAGYGIDGTIHGGEAWLGYPGKWRHFASWRPLFLPGGERASLEPWRSAAAICWEAGYEMDNLPSGAELARHAWKRKLNCPSTTAVGRIFDAAAALIGLCQIASFDGQAPMLLEAISEGKVFPIPLPISKLESGLWSSDWKPLLPMLLDSSLAPTFKAATFHATVCHCLLQQARLARDLFNIHYIGLVGGVFQNQVLTNNAIDLLTTDNFDVALPINIPINDAGISYGQIIEFASW